ncbi:hypothetical protein COHA_009275 [Chlorella ohadii]|uniref:BioF2-like acetyltransferase domain-containing protein n=1 Tax=Chlorella ohadii TaxID=2649997 RepID=A0AAD5DF34_9CHLO|nr:hypothetical protein COHA_009275 [Chlorella ohadii]
MPHGFSGCGSSHALLSPLSRTNEEPSLEVLSAIAGLDSLALGSSGDTDAAQPPLDCCGRYGLDFLRHPVAAYGHLPTPLRQLLALPTPLKRFTVAARPTIEPSGGLLHYKAAVPRPVRRRTPLLAVVDEPGLPADELAGQGGRYHCSYDQYVAAVMGKNQRRNHRLRLQKFEEAGVLRFEWVPLEPGDRRLVQQLWRLYRQNGERNGQTVVCKRDFFRIHLAAEGLLVAAVCDTSRGGAIVSFATGAKCGDTLISTWCGTDYSHPLARSCSCYILTQYEFVRRAIKDPDVRWVDFGALHRTVKHGSLCAQEHAVSTYVRCKSKLAARLVAWAASRWFALDRLTASGTIYDV